MLYLTHTPPPPLADFVAWGLDGVECFRPSLLPEDVEKLRALARFHGLFTTGGSDWHGPHRGVLGDFFISPESISDFLEVRPSPPAVDDECRVV